jgi:hypothetical protein
MPDEHWPSYWSSELGDETRRSLEAELRRELPVGHSLYGQRAVAKAIGEDPDDVVFQLADGRLAAVHLTWNLESHSDWPYTLIFSDLDALAKSDEWGPPP